MIESMFHLHLPLAEKILRPMIVYLFLIVFLRVFGKRELAQLNPFDLVVLLSLSNTVQNAMIGDDNTVTGGVIGALSLLTINWVLSRMLFKLPKVSRALEGSETVLIRRGVVDEDALKKEALTQIELLSILHKNGFNDPSEVEKCVLEPSGTFYVESIKPTADAAQIAGLARLVSELHEEIHALRGELRRVSPEAAGG